MVCKLYCGLPGRHLCVQTGPQGTTATLHSARAQATGARSLRSHGRQFRQAGSWQDFLVDTAFPSFIKLHTLNPRRLETRQFTLSWYSQNTKPEICLSLTLKRRHEEYGHGRCLPLLSLAKSMSLILAQCICLSAPWLMEYVRNTLSLLLMPNTNALVRIIIWLMKKCNCGSADFPHKIQFSKKILKL